MISNMASSQINNLSTTAYPSMHVCGSSASMCSSKIIDNKDIYIYIYIYILVKEIHDI